MGRWIAALGVAAMVASARATELPEGLGNIASWAYQLSNIDPRAVAASGFYLVVVDYSRDGDDSAAFSPAEVEVMQRKPDGGRRIVLAYLSIGEAEEYRYYWQPGWHQRPPAWLDDENPNWPGSFKVRYWDDDWQGVIFGHPEAYLDRILAAGFDGVWLDIIDAFEYYEGTRPTAAEEMADFVSRLSGYAKGRAGREFFIFGQNGERLVTHEGYLTAIDGVGKEDLFYGMEVEGQPTLPDETEYSLQFLERARDAGKLVLTVDYVSAPLAVWDVYARSRRLQFVPYASVRELDRWVVNPGLDPAQGESFAGADRRRDTPGRFFAVTVPKGQFRQSLTVERFEDRSVFTELEPSGEVAFSEISEFDEWTTAAALTFGVTDHLELGLAVPFVRGHMSNEVLVGDDEPGTESDETGLGNVRLLAAAGWTWNDFSDNLLIEFETGLPTDSRGDDFAAGGDGRLAVTIEHYWERLGVIGVVAANYFAEEGFDDLNTTIDFLGGFGLELSSRAFLSMLAGGANGIAAGEATFELILGGGTSLEFFAGGDLEGDASARFAGVSVNFWPASR